MAALSLILLRIAILREVVPSLLALRYKFEEGGGESGLQLTGLVAHSFESYECCFPLQSKPNAIDTNY